MNNDVPAYGLWPLVIINAGVFIIFAFSFSRPRTARDWRSFGAFSAFLVALFTEMYGFPLTIYLLSGWLGSVFPGIHLFSHNTGHLWETLMGWKGDPHLNPLHILSDILIFAGFILLAAAWDVLYKAQRDHRLATTGVLRSIAGLPGVSGGEAILRERRKTSVGTYYSGKHARSYNARWHKYTERTLSETVSLIDITVLQSIIEQQGRRPRILDVACGTGVLLHYLLQQVPGLDAYGVDASRDMLAQAHRLLDKYPSVYLQQAVVGPGERANLPYISHTFDLITYTNALHDAPQPEITLMGLGQLLAPGGQLIVEDYARRDPPFPWPVFEWLIRRAEKDYVRAYTFSEVQLLCTRAGFRMICGRTFVVNWLWHGWVLCLGSNTPESAHT